MTARNNWIPKLPYIHFFLTLLPFTIRVYTGKLCDRPYAKRAKIYHVIT